MRKRAPEIDWSKYGYCIDCNSQKGEPCTSAMDRRYIRKIPHPIRDKNEMDQAN